MSIPSKITAEGDQIKDAFSKVNLTIDNIVTGFTYNQISKNLSISKLNGETLNTTVGNELLINSSNIVVANGYSGWNVPFSSTTFDEVYNYVFSIPYVIDMNSKAGNYFNLTTDGVISGTYDPQRFFNIQLISRNIDGDSFIIKINSNHTKPSIISSTTQNFILNNNHAYIFTYSSSLTTWYNSVIEEPKYNQLVNNNAYYEYIDIYSFSNNGNTSYLISSGYTGNHVYKIKQCGKVIIDNVNVGTAETDFILPDATLFPYEILEIIDLTVTNGSNYYNYNRKKIMTLDGSGIKIPSNSNGLPFIYLNEINKKNIKFINNGVYWYLLDYANSYNNPIIFPPKLATPISPANNYFTSNTLTTNGSYTLNQGKINYSLFFESSGINTILTSTTVNIALPLSIDNNTYNNTNLYIVTSSATYSCRGSLTYYGSSTPSMLSFVKTEYPLTYFTWGDIGINTPFKIYGEVNYGIFGNNNNNNNELYMYVDYQQMHSLFPNYIIN